MSDEALSPQATTPPPSEPTIEVTVRGTEKGFHIPSLDGLRAVSIGIVFLSHAGLGSIVPGGFGVTVFFFLSGYLITTLLRKEEVKSGRISLSKFYVRRIFRIFPPMYVSLGLAMIATALGLLPGAINFYPTLSQALHLTNYFPYMGEGAMMSGTGVLWSLAVEEHFYLLFPLLCFEVMRHRSLRFRALVLVGLCVLVLAWRYYLVTQLHVTIERTYYCTDTRIDSILFGCILGLYFNPVLDPRIKLGAWMKDLIMLVALGAIALSFVLRDPVFRETLRYTVQGVALFPIFYIVVTEHDNWRYRWLNWPSVRFLGVLSYSLYLVHLCCISGVEHMLPGFNKLGAGAVAGALALLIAYFMYKLVEQPSTRARKRFQP